MSQFKNQTELIFVKTAKPLYEQGPLRPYTDYNMVLEKIQSETLPFMTIIFPFMPLTNSFLNLDINLCHYTRDKIIGKLHEAAESIMEGKRPKSWGPFTVKTNYEGQKLDFASSCRFLSQGCFYPKTLFEITFQNHIGLLDYLDYLQISEVTKAIFPSQEIEKNLTDISVSCETFINFKSFNKIPASIKSTLIGSPLKTLLELPKGITECIGDAKITDFKNTKVKIDVSAFEAETLKIHQNFIKNYTVQKP